MLLDSGEEDPGGRLNNPKDRQWRPLSFMEISFNPT